MRRDGVYANLGHQLKQTMLPSTIKS